MQSVRPPSASCAPLRDDPVAPGEPVNDPLSDLSRPVLSQAVTAALRGMIRVYQVTVSPMLGDRCRFYPSCSCYAMQALQVHGPVRGSWLALRRLSRCHPFHPGGIDEVPPRYQASNRNQAGGSPPMPAQASTHHQQ